MGQPLLSFQTNKISHQYKNTVRQTVIGLQTQKQNTKSAFLEYWQWHSTFTNIFYVIGKLLITSKFQHKHKHHLNCLEQLRLHWTIIDPGNFLKSKHGKLVEEKAYMHKFTVPPFSPQTPQYDQQTLYIRICWIAKTSLPCWLLALLTHQRTKSQVKIEFWTNYSKPICSLARLHFICPWFKT